MPAPDRRLRNWIGLPSTASSPRPKRFGACVFWSSAAGNRLAYRSEGKGILEAAEKHPDVFFMMYTNGTLITEAVAGRMAALGNLSPAISLEGWRERTDERRGPGVFDKVLAAMDRLRRAGVPFGISLTATRHNAEEILSDEFMDFLFEQQGALYGWIFHYMPIGRSFTLDLMPTPEQRAWMWQRVWQIIRERHTFLSDFWNHATLSFGCVAGGHTRGGATCTLTGTVPYRPAFLCPTRPLTSRSCMPGAIRWTKPGLIPSSPIFATGRMVTGREEATGSPRASFVTTMPTCTG